MGEGAWEVQTIMNKLNKIQRCDVQHREYNQCFTNFKYSTIYKNTKWLHFMPETSNSENKLYFNKNKLIV